VTTSTHSVRGADAARVGRGAHAAGLVGLAARGALYLLLAVLAVELLTQGGSKDVDTRGALHDLAHRSGGPIVLGLLALGFAGFALWHGYLALVPDRHRDDRRRQVGDAARAVGYGVLCALAVSFLTTSKRAGNSDQTDKTWTARVLHWPAGRVLIVIVGVGVLAGAAYLAWRALSGEAQDEPAVVDAAPRETPALKMLGRVGNIARAVIVAVVGVFLIDAALEYDPNKTVGLDGALKRILDESYGSVLVLLIALGFAAFGVYSIARAWVNRAAPTTAR
jgi:hypothetical protein